MWVADMDFRAPPEVLQAIADRNQHGIYGYQSKPLDLLTLIQSRYRDRYDWDFDLSSLSLVSGVVPAMNQVCRAVLAEGEAAITVTPIYYPFLAMGQNSDRTLIQVPAHPLGISADGADASVTTKHSHQQTQSADAYPEDAVKSPTQSQLQSLTHTPSDRSSDPTYAKNHYPYPIDALREALERNPQVRLLLLCNPWNPVGRVLSRAELEAIGALAQEFDLIICSDEIHFELLFDRHQHLCIANLNDDTRQRTITVSAATKTFNIAGLGGAWVIIENPDLRRKFERFSRGLNQGNNPLTVVATHAALAQCEYWRLELIEHLQSNRALLRSTVEQIEGISMNEIQGTYLAWLNVKELNLIDPAEFFESRGLGLSLGAQFAGPGYMRLNMGCTRATMAEACKRLSTIR